MAASLASSFPEEGQDDHCSSHFKAADERQAKAAQARFDVTGLMLLSCKHDVPLFACDIDTPGEQQKYPLALLDVFMSIVDPYVNSVGVLYDIGCQFARSVERRDLLPSYRHKLHFATALFHSFAHDWGCQSQFSPRRKARFGLTDGEGNERIWSALSKFVIVTRTLGNHRRRELLDWRLREISQDKLYDSMRNLHENLGLIWRKLRQAEAASEAEGWGTALQVIPTTLTEEAPVMHQLWVKSIAQAADFMSQRAIDLLDKGTLSKIAYLVTKRSTLDGTMRNSTGRQGATDEWQQLNILLKKRADSERRLRIGVGMSSVRPTRIDAEDALIFEHLRRHRLEGLWDAEDVVWMQAAVKARVQQQALRDLAVSGKMEHEKASRPGHRIGTKLADQRAKRATNLAVQVKKLAKDYNITCELMQTRKAGDPRNPRPLEFLSGSRLPPGYVIDTMHRWACAGSLDGFHHRSNAAEMIPHARHLAVEPPIMSATPWRHSLELRRALDGFEHLLRVREHIAIVYAEVRRCAAYMATEEAANQALFATSHSPALRWHLQRERWALQVLRSRWQNALAPKKGMLAAGESQEDREKASIAIKHMWWAQSWPSLQTELVDVDGEEAPPDSEDDSEGPSDAGSDDVELSSDDNEGPPDTPLG
ncbi:unnamed protein product [Parajaminaea phylloscopi]